MDTAANERDQARAWQAYAAEVERQQRVMGNYSTLAGYGQNQQNQLGQLGLAYAQQHEQCDGAVWQRASGWRHRAGQRPGEYVEQYRQRRV